MYFDDIIQLIPNEPIYGLKVVGLPSGDMKRAEIMPWHCELAPKAQRAWDWITSNTHPETVLHTLTFKSEPGYYSAYIFCVSFLFDNEGTLFKLFCM